MFSAFDSHSLAFLDVGGGEMLLIFFVVLLLFGGKKMPEFARGLGKSIREFKKATGNVEDEIKRAFEEEPVTSKPMEKAPVYTPPPAAVIEPLTPDDLPETKSAADTGLPPASPDKPIA